MEMKDDIETNSRKIPFAYYFKLCSLYVFYFNITMIINYYSID